MKNYIFILSALILLSSCSSNRPVNQIFKEYKKGEIEFAATLPGWLVNSGLRIALKNTDPETYEDIKTIVPDIDKVRVLVTNDHKPTQARKVISQKMKNGNYDLYAMVNQKDARINIWGKEKKGKIRDLFVLIDADGTAVLLQLKGTIDMGALQKLENKPTRLTNKS